MKFTDDEIKVLRFMVTGHHRRRSTFYLWEIYVHAIRQKECRRQEWMDDAGLRLINSINAKVHDLIQVCSSGCTYKINRRLLLEAFLISSQQPAELSTNEYIERLEFAGMI